MKRVQPKPCLSGVFSLPLGTLEGMSDEELQAAADEARVPLSKLREILAKTRQRRQVCEAKSEAIASLDRKLRNIPHHRRFLVGMMELTSERKLAADGFESQAYDALDKGHQQAFIERLGAAKMLTLRGEFYKLCLTNNLEDALSKFDDACDAEAKRFGNFPSLGSKIEGIYDHIVKLLTSIDHGSSNGLPIDGPALVYSVNLPLNFPRHPRPRRFNDELERF